MQLLEISVIVPVYNVEAYLDRCVRSLLKQTYKNMKIILVDDGSTDQCPSMCDKYSNDYKNIIALHKINGGLSDARNYGVKFADTEWIVFVDSDDYVEPEYIETLVNLKSKYNAQMVITRTCRENEDGTGKPIHKHFKSYLADKKTALYQVYSGMNVNWSAYGKLLSRRVLQKFPFPQGYYEDCACMYKIINELNKIVIADYEHNYHYIQREGSILSSTLKEEHFHIFDIAAEFESFIYKYHPDLDILVVFFYKSAIVQLLNLQTMPWNIYKEIFMKYRKYFRKNLKRIMIDPHYPKKNKFYFLLLCGFPEIFWVQNKFLRKVRSLSNI